jgi:hypothetical protein
MQSLHRTGWLNQAGCYVLYWYLESGAKRLCGEAGIRGADGPFQRAVAGRRGGGVAVGPRYLELALAALGPMREMLARYPLGFAQWLAALDYVLAHPREVSIVGDVEAADTRALLDACATGYRPHQIIALGEPRVESVTVPVLEGRGLLDGRATAYVCLDSVCRVPVTEPEALSCVR